MTTSAGAEPARRRQMGPTNRWYSARTAKSYGSAVASLTGACRSQRAEPATGRARHLAVPRIGASLVERDHPRAAAVGSRGRHFGTSALQVPSG
jgi:hypothetical protein